MAVFRVEKNSGYTVMSNHHLRNRNLSLKAKGLLSQMLSLPEDWDYTLQGLARINRESIDAIRQAIRELEQAGYIQRSRERDEKGRLRGADYVIFELPQPVPASVSPTLENPTLENPTQENPTTVINNYAPYNTANVSQDFISQAESLNGLEDIGNIYLWTSKQPLSENDLARLQELSACSSDIANELENYRVRQEHGVNVYGLDDFPAEYVQVLDGELNTEQWKAGTGVYVTPLRMMGDGSLCLYKPGDQISVTQLDGTNKVYDVLAVVSIPSALQTPLQVDMGLDYIFPTNELLGNMVSADQPAMKTIFNVDEEHQLATENWLKNYTTNTDTALDYLSKVTLRQTFDGMINMYRLVGGALCAILALIGILNFINSMTTSILSRYGEIAMLQSVGMTGRQVKQMLIYEGIGYSILGLLGSLILSVIASLTVVRMMGAELTYFTWHFTLIPVFLCIIPLILITAIVPLVCYNKMAQKTVVERLRLAE